MVPKSTVTATNSTIYEANDDVGGLAVFFVFFIQLIAYI